MTTNDSKNSFLDRLSNKVSDGFKSHTPNDVIHEGISDDELDKLLAADIKSSTRPPTNLSGPAEYTEADIKALDEQSSAKDSSVFMDAIREDQTTDTSSTTQDVSTDTAFTGMTKETSADALNTAVTEVPALSSDDLVLDTTLDTDTTIDSTATPVTSPETASPTISIAGIGAKSNSFSRPQKSVENDSMDSVELDTADMIDMDTATTITIETDEAVDTTASANSDNLSLVASQTETDDTVSTEDASDSATADSSTTDIVTEETADTPTEQTSTEETESDSGLDSTDENSISPTLTTPPIAAKVDKNPSDKPSTQGKPSMTDANQLEKIQSDIDELKRKIHAMSSEYFTAATDSAALISQVRSFDSESAADFTATYNQTRELRKILIGARKMFTELPITLDMLEEALESDLYAAEK